MTRIELQNGLRRLPSILSNLRGKQEINIPVEWPGPANVSSIVMTTTIAANALGKGVLRPEEVAPYFFDDPTPHLVSRVLEALKTQEKISTVDYQTHVVKANFFDLSPDIRTRILHELQRGNLVSTAISVNQWRDETGRGQKKPTDTRQVILLNGYNYKNHRLMIDLIHPTQGPLELPFETLKKTLDITYAPGVGWFSSSAFGFYYLGIFRSQQNVKQ